MDIIISNSSNAPIYEQIITQVKQQIIQGKLRGGDPLPSMRNLAAQLRISVITTKRAYEELERDGFIESYTGRGSFVKEKNQEFIKEETLRQIEVLLENAVNKARLTNVSLDELQDILAMLYNDN